MKSNILIMTDSASDIPADLEKEYEIKILSFPVAVNDISYFERIDFTNAEFYEMLMKANKIPVTSQITSMRFLEEFESAYNRGYQEVIYISINASGSATYSNALMAKDSFFEEHPECEKDFKIHVVDSKTYTVAYGYAVIEAAKKAQRGAASNEILAFLYDWFDSVEIYFAPYTLEFVKKSGRVPVAAAFVGELIGLRPIISIIDGVTNIEEKVRGDKAILPALLKYAQNRAVPKTPYFVVKGLMDKEADDLRSLSKKVFGYPSADFWQIGACISINAGPKVVGIIIKGLNRKHEKD